jgi:hypothetical protein
MRLDHYSYLTRRLATVRSAELVHRVALWIRRRRDRLLFALDPKLNSIENILASRNKWLPVKSGTVPSTALNRALQESLPAGWWTDEGFWEVFRNRYPDEARRLIAQAEEVVSGNITLFQWKTIQLTKPIRWSATFDPSASNPEDWPELYYTDMKVRHDPNNPERDVKWCWELNRFQHLMCLGGAWRLTGDERFPAEAREQIDSWIRSIRYPLGVQWASSLEVALRALSWVRCHILFMNSSSWDSAFLDRFAASMYLHGRHIHEELSVHHPPGNHLLGEASALFCLSLFYPEFSTSACWQRDSEAILNRLVPLLILPDGVYGEQSTGYFRFVCDFILPAILMARRHGMSFSHLVEDRVAAGLQWVAASAQNSRDVPMLGDSDTGVAIGWRLSDYWDFTALLAVGAVLFNRGDLIEQTHELPAEAFLMMGIEGLETFQSLTDDRSRQEQNVSATAPSVSFPHGGYDVSKDSHFHLVFDAGPLGLSPSCGHGHADGLSWTMSFEGTPLVVDTGTDSYNGPPLWRDYFRSALAHSTVAVDGVWPSRPINTFRWSRETQITHEQVLAFPEGRLLRGSVKWGNTTHKRVIFHMFDVGVIVADHLEDTGEHEVDYRIQFDPRWHVRQIGASLVTVSNGDTSFEVSLLAPGMDTSVLKGSENPLGGWYSRYYGHRIASTTLRSHGRCVLPRDILLVLKRTGCDLTISQEVARSFFPQGTFDRMRSVKLG